MEQQTYYTMDDYLKLHQHVLDYKDGVPGSADKIIQSFNNFIWKHVNFITGSAFSLNDTCLRRFISLYMANINAKKHINQYKFKSSIRENMKETAEMIQSLFSSYKPEEIRNELICTLLKMAKKYKDYDRPSFHNYVDKCFHYEAYRALDHLINDPIMRLTTEEYLENDIPDSSVEKEYDVILDNIQHAISIKKASCPTIVDNTTPYDSNSLNTNWVNGITCSDTFKCLTPFEREIADKYGVCRATINRKKQAAIEKLKRVNSDILIKE
jgi:hypothetical protein